MSTKRDVSPRWYVRVGWVTLVIVQLAFLRSYWIPLASGAELPLVVHVHALSFFGWTVLFVLQAYLVAGGHTSLHRRVGLAGAAWALFTIVLGFEMALDRIARELELIDGTFTAVPTIIPLTQICMFTCLVGLAFGDSGPALVTAVFVVSNGAILGVAWYDRARTGRVHPVYLWGGTAILFVRVTRVKIAMSESWRELATRLAEWA